MPIDPISDLIGVTKVHLAIVEVDSGIAKRRAHAFLPSVDLLIGVWVSTKHDVVPTRLERRTHHGLDFTISLDDVVRRGIGSDLPSLQLELAKLGWKEGGVERSAGPRNATVLAAVWSRDAARNVNAVLR